MRRAAWSGACEKSGDLGPRKSPDRSCSRYMGGQGPKQGGRERVLAFGKASKAIYDKAELFVPDGCEDGLESTQGLAGLHGALNGVGLAGVFGDCLNRKVTKPELELEGGQVKAVLVLLGERESLFGSRDDGR